MGCPHARFVTGHRRLSGRSHHRPQQPGIASGARAALRKDRSGGAIPRDPRGSARRLADRCRAHRALRAHGIGVGGALWQARSRRRLPGKDRSHRRARLRRVSRARPALPPRRKMGLAGRHLSAATSGSPPTTRPGASICIARWARSTSISSPIPIEPSRPTRTSSPSIPGRAPRARRPRAPAREHLRVVRGHRLHEPSWFRPPTIPTSRSSCTTISGASRACISATPSKPRANFLQALRYRRLPRRHHGGADPSLLRARRLAQGGPDDGPRPRTIPRARSTRSGCSTTPRASISIASTIEPSASQGVLGRGRRSGPRARRSGRAAVPALLRGPAVASRCHPSSICWCARPSKKSATRAISTISTTGPRAAPTS